MHKYERGKILGKGSFGRAVLAKRRADGTQVVIKEVSMRNMKPAEREAAKQEAEVLASRCVRQSCLPPIFSYWELVPTVVTLAAAESLAAPQHCQLSRKLRRRYNTLHCYGLLQWR